MTPVPLLLLPIFHLSYAEKTARYSTTSTLIDTVIAIPVKLQLSQCDVSSSITIITLLFFCLLLTTMQSQRRPAAGEGG